MTQSADIESFLQTAGWGQASRQPLAGDASARRYLRLTMGAQSAVLMISPKDGPDDPAQFLRIAQHLNQIGLSAPRHLAQGLSSGLLLLEDFGSGVFAHILRAHPKREGALYRQAVDVLAHITRHPAPPDLPNLTAQDWADATLLALTQYRAAILGDQMGTAALQSALALSLARHCDGPRVMILRDYHAENLMELPGRTGLAQVGLLDFQLAQMGQPAYDLVSLLQDARRDVAPATQRAMQRHWCDAQGCTMQEFAASYAVLGAQRALRIIGIFAQLCTHRGKDGYLDLIPRVWAQLQENLTHPALAEVAHICAQTLPPPSPENLNRIRQQCKTRT